MTTTPTNAMLTAAERDRILARLDEMQRNAPVTACPVSWCDEADAHAWEVEFDGSLYGRAHCHEVSVLAQCTGQPNGHRLDELVRLAGDRSGAAGMVGLWTDSAGPCDRCHVCTEFDTTESVVRHRAWQITARRSPAERRRSWKLKPRSRAASGPIEVPLAEQQRNR